jgi:hypothetical protein
MPHIEHRPKPLMRSFSGRNGTIYVNFYQIGGLALPNHWIIMQYNEKVKKMSNKLIYYCPVIEEAQEI